MENFENKWYNAVGEFMKKRIKKITALTLGGVLCCSCFAVGCKQSSSDLTVYMPDGAPALAMAKLMAEDTKDDGVSYKVVAPAKIASAVTNKKASKNADFCILPLTAASKLLGEGEEYEALGVVTHGNLYLVGKEGEYTEENTSSLVGKTVGVLQINEVPGLTIKATLEKYGLPWQEVGNDGGTSQTKVNLKAISGADSVGVIDADCYLLAEPAASAQAKKGYRIVGDLQALYGGEKGYPQAVLVGKKEVISSREGWTSSFVEEIDKSGEWLSLQSGENLVKIISAHLEDKDYATSLKASLLTADVVLRCGIRFSYAYESKGEIEAFLTLLSSVNASAVEIPHEEFYWKHQG